MQTSIFAAKDKQTAIYSFAAKEELPLFLSYKFHYIGVTCTTIFVFPLVFCFSLVRLDFKIKAIVQRTPDIDSIWLETKVIPVEHPALLSLTFRADNVTRNRYKKFIQTCLEAFSSGEEHFNVPILPLESPIPLENYFVFKLENANRQITILGRKIDLYLIAFANSNAVFYFEDIPLDLMRILFPNFDQLISFRLSYIPSYPALESLARLPYGRKFFELSFAKLGESISAMSRIMTDSPYRDVEIGRGFIVIVQMFPECIRLRNFNNLIYRIAETEDKAHFPTDYDVSSQNNWGRMSSCLLEQEKINSRLSRIFQLGRKLVKTVCDAKGILQMLKRG